MTTHEYELAVRRTMSRPAEKSGFDWDQAIFGMGLCGEAGEVTDMLKKAVGHGTTVDRDSLVKELGDVLWYLTAIAMTYGVSLEEIMKENDRKLRKRYPDGFNYEASQNRQP